MRLVNCTPQEPKKTVRGPLPERTRDCQLTIQEHEAQDKFSIAHLHVGEELGHDGSDLAERLLA